MPEFVPHDLPEDWIGEADLNANRVGFQERVVRVVLVFGAPTEDVRIQSHNQGLVRRLHQRLIK